ncbi:hypothetical protein [Oscillibacter sp.]|uniref:hypothetical protein n=1 Tax=Oscillibacter sp. TaxID=1945593 RepID=UPI002D802832|nr:hypothetical protein [Oscillibacter sp.]
MKKEEFEQQIQAMIPRPSPETTADLYELGLEVLDAQGPQDILAALDFIARNFDRSVLQSAYEIIQHGSAALPGEMVAAAVFLQNGDTSAHMSQMADAGHLMCFYTPREMGEVSPLAVCTVIENRKTSDFYSTRFGSFGPEETFSRAKEYAKQRNVTVTQALQRVTVSEEIGLALPGMAKALSDIFKRCPAVAARITFDVDQSRVSVEYNPLWETLPPKRRENRGKPSKNMTR